MTLQICLQKRKQKQRRNNLPVNIFTKLSPVILYNVVGESMSPTFFQNQRLIAIKLWFIQIKEHDIIICKDPRNGMLLVKRIVKIKNGNYFVEGDNKEKSTDSRTFGWLKKRDIFAKVVYPSTKLNS